MKRLPARVVEDILGQIVDRKFPYEEKEEKPRNWAAYNRARINELSNLIELIRQYVDDIEDYELPEKDSTRGPDEQITIHEKAKAILLTEMFQADERTASGLVKLFAEKLGIISEFSPRTIGRAYYDDRVKALLNLVQKKSSAAIQGKETSFSGDGTGLSKSNKVNWERDKEDDKKHKDFDMLSCMIANNYHVCTGFITQQGPINDAPTLKPIWEQTMEIHSNYIEEAQFDAGFISRENVSLVAQHATPYFFPKRNLTLKPKGHPAWRDMLYNSLTDTQNWLREYHKRSNVETYNSCLERRFTKPLNCKHKQGNNTETTARIVIENFAQLNVAREEEGLDLTPKYVT